MTLDTNLAAKPYFNDFDQSKNYYQILYKPSTAVQTRELNNMQSILQDQINKFGRSIYKEGSVIEGCAFTFDNNYNYVKINDTFANNFAIPNVATFVNYTITNPNGLNAIIVNTIGGFQSQDPDLNTLYIKYQNSAVFQNGVIQSVFANNESLQIKTSAGAIVGNVTVATVSNSVGTGYAFTTTEGVIFKKGFFLRVPSQTLVISKYNNVPDNISVGFAATESLITAQIDNTLVDNAAGAPNYQAPGADRFQIVPTLITRSTSDISNTATFFSLADFKAGVPVTIKNDPQYTALGADMARRTYETNGDYVVNPFLLSTQIKTNNNGIVNTSYLSLVSSPGIGYVKGFRVEFINNNTVDLRKGIDTEIVAGQIVSSNYGNYLNVNQYCGNFNNQNIVQVELHNVAKTALTSKSFLSGVNSGYSSSTKIGTAFIRGLAYSSGTPGVDAVYRLYLFNIAMLPGYSASQIKSAIYYTSSVQAVADVVQTYSATLGAYTTVIQDPANELNIHPFGQKALTSNGFSSEAFIYRRSNTTTFQTSGSATITLASVDGTGTEVFNNQGTYSVAQDDSVIVIPTTNGYSSNLTGTVSASTGSATLTGSGTNFFSYNIGDYILVNNEVQRVIAINSATSLTVANNFTSSPGPSANVHQKIWPVGVPINFGIGARSISATSTIMTLNLIDTPNAAFGSTVYYDIYRSSTTSIKKTINRASLIQINTSNAAGGTTGPWCLGLPDIFKLNNVWVGSGTYSKTNADLTSNFTIDNGQKDAFYGLSFLNVKSPLASGSTLLISIDHFTKNESQGHGYFNANSYPIDDANTANTNAIQTYQIPTYFSGIGSKSDLRDCIDFRPYANATANVTSTLTNITTNPGNTVVINIPTAGSYLPTPDSNYTATVTHYMPRVDRIALNTSGQLIVNEGISSNIPVAPLEMPGTMTIGLASVAPYPTLTPAIAKSYNRYDYAVQLTTQQTKRYTMADIGKLAKRVDRLEYYTSLSLLESSAQTLQIRSNSTGQNRFKNGILVDPFRDFSLSNTQDPQFRVALDSIRGEARPFFSTTVLNMYFDSSLSTNMQKTGDIVTLVYTSVLYQKQVYASKYHNCIEGNIYSYRGTMTLDPPGTVDPDITQNPDVVSNIDLSGNWVNLQKYIPTSWGSAWANWTTVGSTTDSKVGPNFVSSQTTNPDGTISQTVTTPTTTTTTNQLQQVGQQLVVTPTQTNVNVGNYVTNVSILPYVKAGWVLFKATGMKPSTSLYCYFNSIPISNLVIPAYLYTGTVNFVNGGYFATDGSNYNVYTDSKGNKYKFNSTAWGTLPQADSTGTVYGLFYIPAATFNSGSIEFKVTDVSNLNQGESAVTTQATATYFGAGINIQKSNAILQVRDATLSTQEVTQQRSVTQSSTSYNSTNITLPAATTINNTTVINNTTQQITNNLTTVNNINNITQVTQVNQTVQNITQVTQSITQPVITVVQNAITPPPLPPPPLPPPVAPVQSTNIDLGAASPEQHNDAADGGYNNAGNGDPGPSGDSGSSSSSGGDNGEGGGGGGANNP